MAGKQKRTADGTPTTTPRAEAKRREEMEQRQAENPGIFSGGRDTGVGRERLHAEDRGDESESQGAGRDRLIPRGNEDSSEG